MSPWASGRERESDEGPASLPDCSDNPFWRMRHDAGGLGAMALLGSESSLEQFQGEDASCRQWATRRAQETTQAAPVDQFYGTDVRQQWYDMSNLQCVYAKGNRVPGVLPAVPPPPPPLVPSTSPPPVGAVPAL